MLGSRKGQVIILWKIFAISWNIHFLLGNELSHTHERFGVIIKLSCGKLLHKSLPVCIFDILPSQIAKICTLNLDGQFEDAKNLNEIFLSIYELLFIESNPIPVKWMLKKMKKIDSGIRLPLVPLASQFHDAIINEMTKLKLL